MSANAIRQAAGHSARRPVRRRIDAYHGKVAIIADELRREIISGIHRPGQRLPTRAELTQRYGVSNLTVQRSLDKLAQDGFIVAHVGAGTFVAERLPHLTNYALLFPTRLAPESRPNLFWTTLARCAERVSGDSAKFTVFEGFLGREGFEGYDRLLADLRASRVAGLIFASDPFPLRGTPLIETPGIPRTGFMSKSLGGMPIVDMDSEGFLERAAQRLAELGRKRVAVIVIDRRPITFAQTAVRVLNQNGLHCPPHWVLAGSLESPHWVGHMLQLLMSLPERQRPDGLILTDQNHAGPALESLREFGCAMPRDLAVIAHCNFPLLEQENAPVMWLGYDVAAGLRQCMTNIDDLRAGREPRRRTRLQACFADELARTS